MALAFAVRDRRGDPWNFVGLTSAFPDLGLDGKGVNERRPCGHAQAPGCKVFEVPRLGAAADAPAEPTEVDPAVPDKRVSDSVLGSQLTTPSGRRGSRSTDSLGFS